MGKLGKKGAQTTAESITAVSAESTRAMADELATSVDALARVRAEIKALGEKETELAAALKTSGLDRIDGQFATALVVRYVQESTDWKAIAEKIGYSAQLKTAHTKSAERVSVRTSAKLLAPPIAQSGPIGGER